MLLLASTVAGGACVSSGTHRRTVDEFTERVELLEASNESLSSERVQLLEEIEDMREAHEELAASIADLEEREAELQERLRGRETELAERTGELEGLRGTYRGLVADLEAELAAGQIEIERLREGLRLNLAEAILFPSGSAQLKPTGREVLTRVATRLSQLPDRVEVQGHTDDVPIHGALAHRFATNWELAAARATGVVRWLESHGVDPARLMAVSYGEHRPLTPNTTIEERARNRRIEIRLIPAEGAPAEPPTAPAD